MTLNFPNSAYYYVNKLIPFLLILVCLNSYAQSKSKFNKHYYDHWEAIDSTKSLLEIIIYKNKKTTRIVEIDLKSRCEYLSSGVLFMTIYVYKNDKGNMEVETINPINFEILDSEYILKNPKKLLRITNNDTLAFKKRYK